MRSLRLVSSCAIAVALASLVGCAADSSDKSEVSSDSLNENAANTEDAALADDVAVETDRLVFSNYARTNNRSLMTLNDKIKAYATEYQNLAANAPSEVRGDSASTDAWVISNLNQRNVAPVILVGRRSSDALDANGDIKKDSKNPNGFLRRAIGVTETASGELVVETRPATIFEAHDELVRQGMIAADGTNDQWQFQQSYPFTLADINLNRTLYEKQLMAGLGTVRVGLQDSYLRINGNLDALAAGRWASPREAHAILTTSLEGKVNLVASFDGAFSASTGPKKLYEREFAITSVAGYPLAIDFDLSANCDFGANGRAVAEAGATVNGSVRAGGEYTRDSGGDLVWQPQFPTFNRLGPTLTSNARVEALCTLTATTRARIFDQSGPQAVTSAFVRVDANADGSAGVGSAAGTAHAKVTGGIEARAEGSLEPFGVHLLDVSTPTYRREWVLFDQNISVSH